jgi:hypothetical protein
MAFTLIRGTFVVVGKSPDGDSVRFAPDNIGTLMSLRGPKPQLKQGDSVQLRLEAIDALETHYTQGHNQVAHQPLGAARAARDFLLDELAITQVVWNANETLVASANDGTRGYILSRTFEQNRRPVSFVYAGDPDEADGDSIFLKEDRLKASINYRSLLAGHVYPTYYEGVFADLRAVLNTATATARTANAADSVWAIDATRTGVDVPPFANIVDQHALLPKLFRRLSQYLKAQPGDLSGFLDFLEASPDPCIYIPDADPTSLHRFVEVHGDKVKLTVDPEQLIFLEKKP